MSKKPEPEVLSEFEYLRRGCNEEINSYGRLLLDVVVRHLAENDLSINPEAYQGIKADINSHVAYGYDQLSLMTAGELIDDISKSSPFNLINSLSITCGSDSRLTISGTFIVPGDMTANGPVVKKLIWINYNNFTEFAVNYREHLIKYKP